MRLKRIVFLGVGFIFFMMVFSCNRELLLMPNSKYDHPREFAFMDTIKTYSPARTENFEITLKSRNALHLAQPEFVKNYLSGRNIPDTSSERFEFNDYSNYYFFDYQNFKTWVLFTILADTESGFMELYQFTYHKRSGKISSVSRIGVYEGDGGASRYDLLSFSKSGRRLKIRTKFSYSQDLFDENGPLGCYSLVSDSIVSKFYFCENKTKHSVDTVYSKLDTICSK